VTDLNALLGRLRQYAELPLEEIRTLDPEHYTSPALFGLEIEHIWKKEWILVGHVCELKKPGDFFAFDLINEPMIVVRGEDMKIRAVSSVCRHRFMPVVRHGTRGNAGRFVCPYHKWTYGLDGELKSALYMQENRCFHLREIGLPEFRLEIWNDLIWVNLDDNAKPLAPRLSDIEDKLSFYKLPKDYVGAYPYDKIWEANWKLCVENNEGYHSFAVHQETVNVTAPTSNFTPDGTAHGDYWTSARWNLSTNDLSKKRLKDLNWKEGYMGQNVPAMDVAIIYPANGITYSPTSNLGWYTHWPVSIDKTRAWMGMASLPEDLNPAWVADPSKSGLHKVLDEDLSAFEGGIGWGVKSSKLRAGLLSRQEENVLRAHQWTARRILESVG